MLLALQAVSETIKSLTTLCKVDIVVAGNDWGFIAIAMFATVCLLMVGFPVAFTLAGTALGFAALGILSGTFDASFLNALTGRIFGTMNNDASPYRCLF